MSARVCHCCGHVDPSLATIVRRGGFAASGEPPVVTYQGSLVPMWANAARFMHLLVSRGRVHRSSFSRLLKPDAAESAVTVTIHHIRSTLDRHKPGLGAAVRTIATWGYELVEEQEMTT